MSRATGQKGTNPMTARITQLITPPPNTYITQVLNQDEGRFLYHEPIYAIVLVEDIEDDGNPYQTVRAMTDMNWEYDPLLLHDFSMAQTAGQIRRDGICDPVEAGCNGHRLGPARNP